MLHLFAKLSGIIAILIALPQCQTMSLDMRKSGKVPTVTVEGVYADQIRLACDSVFQEADYRFLRARGNRRFIYEKPGTAMHFLAYGDFSMSDDKIVERLSISVQSVGPDAYQIDCEPFIVTDPDDHMEEARPISRLKRGKYQSLLNQVKALCDAGGVDTVPDGDHWD